MAKIPTFPTGSDLEQFSSAEDDKGFETVLNKHPEVKTLYERRDLYPGTLAVNGVNPVLHVMMEGIVENQLHAEIGVREIYEKLQEEKGLAPHAALACLTRVLIPHFFEVLNEHKAFDQEAYVRRLSVIGKNVDKLGRNDHCPCGSGAKFKRCCAPYAEAFKIYPLAGRLDLGYGSYIQAEPQDIRDPLDPIFQLEARFHIADYMEHYSDLEGALTVLKENITLAESYEKGNFLENAWQDYLVLCQNHAELHEEGLNALDHLLALAKSDKEKGTLLCDKADFLVEMGNMEAAEAEYIKLFDALPDFAYGRFRYASMLYEQEREQDAKKVLTDLLSSDKSIDEETRSEAIALLEDLGEDTL